MHRLNGKTALITGGARGLGGAIARRFAQAGAQVIVNDLVEADAERAGIALGGYGVAADVSNPDAVDQMFEIVRARSGALAGKRYLSRKRYHIHD